MAIADKSKENPKESYKYITDRKVTRNHIGPLISADGQLEYSNEGMCDISNNYFSSVFLHETPQSEVCDKSFIKYQGLTVGIQEY